MTNQGEIYWDVRFATHEEAGQECIESESMLPQAPGVCRECGHIIHKIASPDPKPTRFFYDVTVQRTVGTVITISLDDEFDDDADFQHWLENNEQFLRIMEERLADIEFGDDEILDIELADGFGFAYELNSDDEPSDAYLEHCSQFDCPECGPTKLIKTHQGLPSMTGTGYDPGVVDLQCGHSFSWSPLTGERYKVK